eukprot:NODE_78_length_23131_cov_0.599427.p4 type:complete len:557 gc:universal NODE_78_length_23131_cov_0.599427:15928-14258(-)
MDNLLHYIENAEIFGEEVNRIRKLSSSNRFVTFEDACKGSKDQFHCKLAFQKLVASGEINFGFVSQQKTHDSKSPIFAILGGGISGMISALQLRNLHHSYSLPDPYVVICEADSSLGGRLKGGKLPFRGEDALAYKPDYGCQFLYDIENPKIKHLIHQLGWCPKPIPCVWECAVYNMDGSIVPSNAVMAAVNTVINVLRLIDRSKSNKSTVASLLSAILEKENESQLQLINLIVADLEYRYGSFDVIYPCHLPDITHNSFKKYAIPQQMSSLILKFDDLLANTYDSVNIMELKNAESESLSDLLLKDYDSGIYCLNDLEIEQVSVGGFSGSTDKANVEFTNKHKFINVLANAGIVCTPPYQWKYLFANQIKSKIRNSFGRAYNTCLETASIVFKEFDNSNEYFYVLAPPSEALLNPERGLFFFFTHIKEAASVLTSFSVGKGAESILEMDGLKRHAKLTERLSCFNLRAQDMICSNFGNCKYIRGGKFVTDPDVAEEIKTGLLKFPLMLASDCLFDGTIVGAVESATMAAASLFQAYYKKELFDFKRIKEDAMDLD